jgi:putative membrane protein
MNRLVMIHTSARAICRGQATNPPDRPAVRAQHTDESQGRWSQQVLHISEWGLLIGGLVLIVYLWRELGITTLVANLRLVGWGIAPIVLQECLACFANTLGWLAAFARPRPPIRLPHLLAARIAGDAINYVTPTATLGGEFVRTRLLRGQAAGTAIAASVAVAKLSQMLGQIAFISVGLALSLYDTPLPATLRLGLLGGLAACAALAGALVLVQRRGMFAPLLWLAQRWGWQGHASELDRRLRHLDAEIAQFHRHAQGALGLSVASFFVGWALGAVEIYLILWFLDVPITMYRALTIEALSVAIDGMLFFVPAKVGTQEGGKVLIFTLLGLDPAKGLALGMLRRIRELTWALIGLGILSRQHLRARPTVSAVRAALRLRREERFSSICQPSEERRPDLSCTDPSPPG